MGAGVGITMSNACVGNRAEILAPIDQSRCLTHAQFPRHSRKNLFFGGPWFASEEWILLLLGRD